MKFFKNLFKKKKEEVVKVEETKQYSKNAIVCEFCKKEIYQHDKSVKKAKVRLHTKCWRKIRKQASQSNFQSM